MGRRQASPPPCLPRTMRDVRRGEPHRRMRQPYPRLSAFRFLDLFGERGEANGKTETHRSVLVRKPGIRASRGWRLQNSGAGAPRERDSILRTCTLPTHALSGPLPLRERASPEVQHALWGEGSRPPPLTRLWSMRGRAALSRKGRGQARMRRENGTFCAIRQSTNRGPPSKEPAADG